MRVKSSSRLAELLAVTLMVPLGFGLAHQSPAAADPVEVKTTEQAPMVLRYSLPAAENQWEGHSLPIGNGAMGANVFGGVGADLLTLNEKTLWSGGPGVAGYRYGNYPDDQVANRHERLQWVRDQINANGQLNPSTVMSSTNLGQPKVGYGTYQSFGKLRMTVPNTAGYTNYERSLDLDKAQANVTYTVGGVNYHRDVIASHPDNVIVQRLTASQDGKITFTSTYDKGATGGDLLANATVTAADGRITLKGAATNNGLRYNAQVRIVADGGTMTANADNSITVADANSALVIWAGGTDYAETYPAYRTGADPEERITGYVDAAATKGWDALVTSHRADYQPLFQAMKLDLDGAPLTGTTNAIRAAYTGTTAQDRSLEELYTQYGRYLLIASSREGSLPANLQGVWTNVNNPPWSADYHVNINLQMNYWPAWSTNLGETHRSYLDYIKSLIEPGRVSASNVVGVDEGWMVMNETTPYGFTGVYDWSTAAWFPEANAWIAQAFWWEYLYSGDETFLRDEAYPVLKETAQFWATYLQNDPRDGSLVANPSYSPEHGWFTAGAAMSQQIATELFTTTLEAADKLGISDSFTTDLAATLAKTDNGLRIADGKIKEWKTDNVSGVEQRHRHVSQLYALFPGRAISADTPELLAAAKGTLVDRGDAGTGWSRAWKVNFWAHIGDGDHAHRLLTGLLRDSTLPNLWDTHPPFQIDGNFGGTSGVTEMLVQNESDSTAVLPALPSAWPNGSFDGVRAWGDATLGATWRNGQPVQVRFETGKAGERSVSGPIAQGGKVRLTDASGNPIEHVVKDGKITFTAAAGVKYIVEPLVTLEIISAPESLQYQTQGDLVVRTSGVTNPALIKLTLPEGWQADRVSTWAPTGEGETTFRLRAPNTGSVGTIGVRLVSDAFDLNRSVSMNLVDPALIGVGDTKVVAWDSQELTGESRPSGLALAAADGNANTFWHTKWSGGADQPPHFIVIDLGETRKLEKVIYTPRANGTTPRNGQIQNYKVEVATEGEIPVPTAAQYGTPTAGAIDGVVKLLPPDSVTFTEVAAGSFPTNTTAPQTITFDTPVATRYVKLISTTNGAGGPWAHAAEINFGQAAPEGSPELPGDEAAPVVSANPTEVTAGQSTSVTAGGFPANTAVNVALQGGGSVEATTDANGFAVVELPVPAAMASGARTITATAGDKTATTQISVTAAPTPDPTPSTSAEPSTTPSTSAEPSMTPSSTATPTMTPSSTTAPTTPAPGTPMLELFPDKAVVGDQFTVTGSGFGAYQSVKLELRSDPISLGAVTTDANGGFTVTLTVPKAPAGQHQVVAIAADGRVAAAPLQIVVKSDLPNTGAANLTLLLAGAAVALTAGAAALVMARRRRA